MIRRIWDVLSRPTNDPRPDPRWYRWAVNQCGHVLVGACGGTLIPDTYSGAVAALFIGAVYGAVKEAPDCILRGGRLRDCLVDTAFVAIGATYAGPAVWPWLILVMVGVGIMAMIRADG